MQILSIYYDHMQSQPWNPSSSAKQTPQMRVQGIRDFPRRLIAPREPACNVQQSSLKFNTPQSNVILSNMCIAVCKNGSKFLQLTIVNLFQKNITRHCQYLLWDCCLPSLGEVVFTNCYLEKIQIVTLYFFSLGLVRLGLIITGCVHP